MQDATNISRLITKKLKGTISASEQKVLDHWLNERDENKVLFDKINDEGKLLGKIEVYNMFDKVQAWKDIDQRLSSDKKIIPLQRQILRYAAAIIPFLILAYGAFYYLSNLDKPEEQIVSNTIEPGTERATLILEDGSTVDLESQGAPKEIVREGLKISNTFKMLRYPELKDSEAPVFHELVTPRGGKYGIVLPDGTEVLLNAGTTLRYPTTFSAARREVYLQGEAYLKVQKDTKPFIVHSNDMDVRVLGTTFNVEAYDDEQVHRATLIEGKVQVAASGKGDQILNPNEQAILNFADGTLDKATVNARQYTSWIEGKFEFANDDLETVMKKLSRWYDFEYTFENPDARNFHFSARIDDKQDISAILDMLQMTTSVKFEMADKTIMIR